MKVTILGAGVIGVTTAYYLNKLGHEVTVIERNDKSAAECSFANGGQLSYSHAEPWATPGVLKKIPKWLINKDSPLVFHPSFNLSMWKWALQFLARCTEQKKLEATRHTMRLALHSGACLKDIIADTNIDFSYLDKGTVHIFRHEKELADNLKQSEFQKQFDCAYEVLTDRAACERIEPALKYSPAKIIGGIFYPKDATGDVNQFTVNLAQVLQQRGVKFVYGTTITGILSEGNKITGIKAGDKIYTADKFVVAAGAASPLLLNKIGINVPIYPMKGYSLSINIQDFEKTPISGITDQYNKIVYSRIGKILRVAGTAEFNGYNDTVNKARIKSLRKMVVQLFPDCGDINTGTEWACLRPSTPEGTPVLGPTKYNNLFLNTGHGTLGWTLSCGSAEIVANITNGKDPQFDLTGLTLAKY